MSSKPTSWRDVLPIHPAAELFPRMPDAELAALGKDIKKNSLTFPIALWCDGKSPVQLLDGISRLDAIEKEIGPAEIGPPSLSAGKDFLACNKVIVLDKSVDPWAYVISANIHRRHLTPEKKRDLIAKLLMATPEKSNRQIAETVKVDHKTVASVRAEKEATGEIPQLKKTVGKDGKSRQQPARRKTTTTKLTQVSEEVLQQRAAAADRIRALLGGTPRDDIGPTPPAAPPPVTENALVDTVAANPITDAWDNASEAHRQEFVKQRGVEITRVESPPVASEAHDLDDGIPPVPAANRAMTNVLPRRGRGRPPAR